MQANSEMSRGEPRIAPLESSKWTPETQAALKRWDPVPLFHQTVARNPETLGRWTIFGEHIFFHNLLPLREREIVVLRVASNLGCDYEWGAHKRYALAQAVLTEAEINSIAGVGARQDWREQEAALIDATDELQSVGMIGDATWATLASQFDQATLIDLIFLVGEFVMVGMIMKTLRIELDPGSEPLPDR